ncbi:MAG: hypothetical protein K6F37_00185 [Lachnospiraceae bacterium]|nr:hypothetical protein [Lachnospiraceae bacterium]
MTKKSTNENDIREETLDKIERLASSYTPEWRFDRDNPDIGTALGMVYADQTEAIGEKRNRITERYHREFVNFLDLSLLPAKPAKSIVLMSLTSDTIAGAYVPKGTKLMASEIVSEAENVVFETEQSLYVTSSSITDIFMSDTKSGKVVPLKGNFDMPGLLGSRESDGEEGEEDGSYMLMAPPMEPFTLFGVHEGIGDNMMVFYHPSVFDVENTSIYMKIEGGADVYKGILDGSIKVFYYNDYEIFSPVDEIKELGDGETLVIKKSLKCGKMALSGKEYSVLALYMEGAVKNVITATRFSFASAGDNVRAEVVCDSGIERDKEDFLPFSDTLNLYSEIYIGHDSYFSMSGAHVTMRFHVEYEEESLGISRVEEDARLLVIKRKPRNLQADVPVQVHADEITIEYYNGIGWSILECDELNAGLFADGISGDKTISFTVPDDWKSTVVLASEGKFLRMRLVRADNCYMRPAVHFCPRVTGLRMDFSYLGNPVEASRVLRISGSSRKDVTLETRVSSSEGKLVVFKPSAYTEDSLYLGFDKRPADGPVSIFFSLADEQRFSGVRCRFEYSRGEEFLPLKVLDHTEGFTKSGTVFFIPQPDWNSVSIEERRRFWIRITRIPGDEKDSSLPRVAGIQVNAVEVSNIDTHEVQEYYIEEAVPDMKFALSHSNILSADVWVNEYGLYGQPAMKRKEQEDPDNIRSERDVSGRITAFYVRWHEVDSLSTAEDKRAYVLDRMNRQIIFGDGLKTDFPRVTDNIAFTVQIKSCLGRAGNVPVGAITAPVGNFHHLGEVINPVKAFGGSDMETMDAALERGADILHSRYRLITVSDYERACKRFSDSIDQVKCLVTEDSGGLGVGEDDIALLLLMTDFESGSYSFHRTEAPLREYICDHCEITIPAERIKIMEPVYVAISVDIWGDVVDIDDSFELQPMVKEVLDAYLSPVKGKGNGGWRIGVMPKIPQIMMRLGNLKSRLIIRKISVSASWTDADGRHEQDLSELSVKPYMVCRSGEHKIHITQG